MTEVGGGCVEEEEEEDDDEDEGGVGFFSFVIAGWLWAVMGG